MKILAYDVAREGVSFADIKPHLVEEARHAWQLYKQGIIREMYLRSDEKPGAVIMLECESVAAAQALMHDLPLVKHGLIRFEFIPLQYFMPFSALFDDAKIDPALR